MMKKSSVLIVGSLFLYLIATKICETINNKSALIFSILFSIIYIIFVILIYCKYKNSITISINVILIGLFDITISVHNYLIDFYNDFFISIEKGLLCLEKSISILFIILLIVNIFKVLLKQFKCSSK